ncbi:histidinol-phosphate transaminase [Candidatus Viridilinea mediisalina]|uniref:Histidinol-phosphate aminotransferase n=1 Tax=Candidatus Viridilinea mediisalina TaxID=2024553 RepID=A0A2A6REC1_9CHLR|nr:histidinol-phosphate transaminase [Candidatus Viridilinea mediisalina]PDW00972.1 histidinol-phosphate transaminase [Candidatus Viridilinea mediisalina]
MFTPTSLIRPEIAELEAYTPIQPLEVLAERLGLPVERLVKLDANENPYGPPPRVWAALADEQHYHIYPDPGHSRLRAALADYTGQAAETILCGAGADELIDLILRLILRPGEVVLDCPPTFGMYSFDTGVCGGRVVQVARQADFGLDLPAIEAAVERHKARVIFLAAPNNPSGNLLPPAQLERLLALPLLVVVDEAYLEFAGVEQGYAPWVAHHANLAVLRTFSKWAGLAGMRVGYGIFPPWLIEQLWKIKQPYNVSVAGQVAALAALEDRAWLLANVARIVAERERLMPRLAALPYLEPCPSAANFILCRVLERSAHALKQALEAHGILVRYYHTPLLRDYIRISVGTPAQSDALLGVLADV